MDKVQICSVAPHAFSVRRPTYNCFVDIPKAPANGYSSTWVTDHNDNKRVYLDLKNVDITEVLIKAADIAADIFKTEQLKEKGCFIPAGAIPTQQEVADARNERTEWLVRCATEGDNLYSQFGDRGIQQIPDFCKRAVVELKETRPWVFTRASNKSECPVCGESLRLLSSGLPPAICKSCHSVLDPERAAKYQPASAQSEAPAKRKYTRKPKATEEISAT